MPGNQMFSTHHPHKSVEAFLPDFPLPSLKRQLAVWKPPALFLLLQPWAPLFHMKREKAPKQLSTL